MTEQQRRALGPALTDFLADFLFCCGYTQTFEHLGAYLRGLAGRSGSDGGADGSATGHRLPPATQPGGAGGAADEAGDARPPRKRRRSRATGLLI